MQIKVANMLLSITALSLSLMDVAGRVVLYIKLFRVICQNLLKLNVPFNSAFPHMGVYPVE